MVDTGSTSNTDENSSDLDLDLINVARNITKGHEMYNRFKLVFHGLPDVSMACSEENSTLYDFYNYLKCSNYFEQQDEALVFVYQVLNMIGYSPMPLLPESLLKDNNYSVRKQYSNVNLRVIALELVDSLSMQEKELLMNYLLEEKNLSLTAEPAILATAMFDEGVVTGPTHLHLIAECFNHETITGSVVDGEGSSRTTAEQELNITQLRSKVCRMRKKKYLKHSFKVVFIIFLIIFIAMLGSTIYLVLRRPLLHHTYSDQYNVTDNSTTALDTDGYTLDTDKIEFTLSSNDREADITVYQWTGTSSNFLSDTTKTEKLSPPHVVDPLYTGFFKRQPLNYNGGDNPIYGVTGTQLKFLLMVWSSLTTPSCLKIRVFRNQSFYSEAVIENGETNLTFVRGTIDHSHCLPVGTHDSAANATWSYTFNETGYVYVSFDEGADMHILGGYITGTVKMFDLLKLTPACSASITMDLKHCAVNICRGHGILCLKPDQHDLYLYVFLKSNGVSKSKLDYKITKVILSLKEFILLVATGIFLIILLVMILLRFAFHFIPTKCTCLKSLNCLNRSQNTYHPLSQVGNDHNDLDTSTTESQSSST